jgi:hypothetical protein
MQFPEVEAVFAALIKFKSLQERYHDQENRVARLRDEAVRDDGRKDVEQSLTR